jgi:lysyl-tRNA synthetase class 2
MHPVQFYSNSSDLITAADCGSSIAQDGRRICMLGRVLSYRKMGGVAFGHIVDNSDQKLQFAFNKRDLGSEVFADWSSQPKIGDIVGLCGKLGRTSTNELTLMVTEAYTTLQAAGPGFPDKFHGITDVEAQRRKRWLVCATEPEQRKVFRLRSKVIQQLREILDVNDYMEVETPILTPQASGALAKPFITHHNALDADFYLRIAPETYLKRMVAGGFDRVFEIGKQFRNEGTDPSHLQEFTSLEWYAAYQDYNDNLNMFRSVMRQLAHQFNEYEIRSKLMAWVNAPVVSYRDLFMVYTNKDVDTLPAKEIDLLFKLEVRPNLVDPIYVIDYPAHLSPMAHRKACDPATVEQWQFIVDGWELVKCYSELTDAKLQRELLEEQAEQRVSGDEETMMLEEDFLDAMEKGMPVMSGLGLGLDRMIAILAGVQNLRDVVYFPTYKAELE